MAVNSVTFPVELGGDGMELTDDDNPTTGLANGGNILRFVPALRNMVAVARYVVDLISGFGTVATQAVIDTQTEVNNAAHQVTLATEQVTVATQKANVATQQAAEALTQAGHAADSAQAAKSHLDNLIATAQQGIDAELTTALSQFDGTVTTSTQAIHDLVNQAIAQVAQDVSVAIQKANDAANSAALSQTYAQALLSATSTTAIDIAKGTVTLTIEAGRQFALGQNVKISHDISRWMCGGVVSYSGTTLVVLVNLTGGVGNYSDWTVTVSGVQGEKGNDGTSFQNLALMWL
jgi:hypothetical protein